MTKAPEIRVPIEQLTAKADSTAENIRRMETILQQLEEVVRRTGNYWIGDAGEQCRKMYLEQEETRQRILVDCLGKSPDELRETVRIFTDAVTRTAQTVAQLPNDLCTD